ncbi:MAG: hypothetical protein H6807_13960 [Planctomycetes bacterium]|nr:hypothetical protein [Planctomycetota bacterium]
MPDIEKGDLLRQLGFASDHELLLAKLEEAGLTNARKARIAASKTEAVATALAEAFIRVCTRGDCQERGRVVAKGRAVVKATAPSSCDVCSGSAASPALKAMQKACAKVGWTRICVVGGSPNARREIESTEAAPIEFRLVEGTKARTKKAAAADLAWADLVVIWGGTQLDHKVSKLYMGDPKCSSMAKRSVAELFGHVAEAARLAAGT